MSIKVPVLVINASYEPVAICTGKRALTLWAKGRAAILETYPHPFYKDMLLPSVIRLLTYRHVPRKKHTVSRRNLLLRDRNTCQYCLERPGPAKLTLDHVYPKSRGGPSTWENLVACCLKCNNVKADRTPEEAGFKLAIPPKAMSLHAHRSLMRQMGEDVSEWRKYLYF